MIYILIYVSGFFAARWMNKKLNNIDSDFGPLPPVWLLSWVAFFAYLVIFVMQVDLKFPKWFIGKGWK